MEPLKILFEPWSHYVAENPWETNCSGSEFSAAETQRCFGGSLLTLLNDLARLGNFSYNSYRVGHFFQNESFDVWVKAVDLVKEGRVDFVLIPYTVTPHRSAQFNFATPPYNPLDEISASSTWSIIREGGKNGDIFNAKIFSVFSNSLWILLVLSLISVAGFMSCLEWGGKLRGWSFSQIFLLLLEKSYRILTVRDNVAIEHSRATNLMLFSWSIVALIFASLYAGSIISATTTIDGWQAPFYDLETMNQAGYR